MKKWLVPLFSFALSSGFCQPHLNAHAHNDYEHSRPLFDALENRFISIEADVHLVNGRLLVSHNRPATTSSTLEELYLIPLDSIRKNNGGWIYKEQQVPLLLMIDIKTDGEETFKILTRLLSQFEGSLNTAAHNGAIQVFVSGNRPLELIRNDTRHFSAIDGRPEDLGKGYSSKEMPVISENYKKITNWNGKGTPPQEELERVIKLAAKAHAENKKLRLWGIPDTEGTWSVLLDAGVDLINTDRLQELNQFLTNKRL
jgi:hypothetical protein